MAIPRLLTVTEAGKVLRLSRNGVLRMVRRGELPVVRYPGSGQRASKLVIREADIEKFLEEHTFCGFS
jgi:excisionase family DNA binding protein